MLVTQHKVRKWISNWDISFPSVKMLWEIESLLDWWAVWLICSEQHNNIDVLLEALP